jgi:hypothetical protein
VLEFFANRSQRLLVMDIAAGDGWDKLLSVCPIQRPFPWEGRGVASP